MHKAVYNNYFQSDRKSQGALITNGGSRAMSSSMTDGRLFMVVFVIEKVKVVHSEGSWLEGVMECCENKGLGIVLRGRGR